MWNKLFDHLFRSYTGLKPMMLAQVTTQTKTNYARQRDAESKQHESKCVLPTLYLIVLVLMSVLLHVEI
jgi:hypothetical protein